MASAHRFLQHNLFRSRLLSACQWFSLRVWQRLPFPSSMAMKELSSSIQNNLLLTLWRTGCEVRRWDNMKQISHLAFRESSSSSTTGTSDKHKHNWIAAVCLPIRESVFYVLSSYRLQIVDEEMARIRVNCSPNTYKRSTRGWKTWIQTQESSLFHCHMCWVILSCCWDKRTEKRRNRHRVQVLHEA